MSSSNSLRDALLFGIGSEIPDDFIAYGGVVTVVATNMVLTSTAAIGVKHTLSADSVAGNHKGEGRTPFEAAAVAAHTTLVAPASGDARYDLIQVNVTTGVASIKAGTAALVGLEVPPAPDAGNIVLARIGPMINATTDLTTLVDNTKRTVTL